MRYENNERLREYLDRGAAGAYREPLRHPRFEFDDEAFAASLDQVCAQFPDLSLEEAEARAAFRLLTSGVAPEVAAPLPSRWFRTRTFVRERSARSWPWLKLAWAIAVLVLCATAVALLSALVVRAEPTPPNMQAIRRAMRGVSLLPAAAAPQQPGGIILQFQQGGSALATRPAGLVAFNCGTGMSCSFTGSTFTLTSTGAGGSGCTPPGTPSRFLYDDGAGGCLDSGLTWTSATSTATAPTGVTLTYSGSGVINARKINNTEFTNSESLGKIPIGQGDGTAVWADPLVQGLTAHDAVGTSTNPVLTGGYASGTAPTDVSNDGDAVRAWFLRNGSQVFNLASGGTLVTLGQKPMASSLPVAIASDQSAITVTQTAPASLRTQLYGFDGAAVQAVSTNGAGVLSTLQNIGALGDGETNVGRLGSGASQAILGGASYMFNGTNWDRMRGNATDGLLVNLGTNNDITGTVTANAGTGTFTNQQSNVTEDYDTGAGTQTLTKFGIALPASGGSVAGGTATNPIRTDPTGATTQPVSGTVTVTATDLDIRNLTATDTVTVTDGAGALNVIVDSGTVTANQGTPASTANRWPMQITDGTDLALVTAAGEVSVNCGNCTGSGASAIDNTAFTGGSDDVAPMGALYDTTPPAITDGNLGAPRMDSSRNLHVNCIVGCAGGSTTPSDNFTNPTNAGNSAAFNMVWDGATWDRLPGTSADGALVNLGANNDVTVTSGTVTANAGTNLNTSALSLEATQADVRTSVQKLDNIAHAGSDVALAEHVPLSGQLDDTATTTVTENQVAPLRITSGRALHVAQQGTVTVTATDLDIRNLTATDTVTVTDGAGALNVICDSGCGGGTQYAEDTALAAGEQVTMAGVIRDDTPASLVDLDGDRTELQVDGTGYLWTRVGAALPAGTNNIGDVDVATLPSVTIGTFPDNEPFNVAQMNGVAVTMGNGVAGTGVQRVTLASDSTGQVAVASLPNEGEQTAANSISVTLATDNDPIGATGAAPPGEAVMVGGLSSGATGGFLQGLAVCDSFVNVDIVTATTTLLVTGVSGRHVRICSMSMVTAGANNVALISGTGATCGTGTTGMNGGTTAAEGWNFAANGGLTQGSGIGAINQTNATGDSVCAITSAATQLSGRISYTIY